jgi:hypothetical protein
VCNRPGLVGGGKQALRMIDAEDFILPTVQDQQRNMDARHLAEGFVLVAHQPMHGKERKHFLADVSG